MRPRPTFKHGKHLSRMVGGWAPLVRLGEDAIGELAASLGRTLTLEEIAAIEESCSALGGLFEASQRPEPRRQDVTATLAAIASMDEDSAKAAYRNADGASAALIRLAMRQGAEFIADAAARAAQLHAQHVTAGGRPMLGWQRFAVKAAVHHWRACGGTNERVYFRAVTRRQSELSANTREDGYSPLLAWTRTMCGAINPAVLHRTPTLLVAMVKAELEDGAG